MSKFKSTTPEAGPTLASPAVAQAVQAAHKAAWDEMTLRETYQKLLKIEAHLAELPPVPDEWRRKLLKLV